ncbi:LOW QUALITY PROTEIN: venom prothrombin activator porpharin-D-like [Discoglossus pictus]
MVDVSYLMTCSVFIVSETAHHVLRKRANHLLEDIFPGNLERECYEETCSKEEAREIFKSHEKTTEFWYHYKDLSPCKQNPCQNGGICQQYHYTYTCLCPPRYSGRNCENMRLECWYKNGGCWQYCRDTARSLSVSCSCAHGYTLNEDGKRCDKSARFPCGLMISSTRSLIESKQDSLIADEPHHQSHLHTEVVLPSVQRKAHSARRNETTKGHLRNETIIDKGANKTSGEGHNNESDWTSNENRTRDGWNETNTIWRQDQNMTVESGLLNNRSKVENVSRTFENGLQNETSHIDNGNITSESGLLNETSLVDNGNRTNITYSRTELIEVSKNVSEENKDSIEDIPEMSEEDELRIVGGTRCELGQCPWQVLIRSSRGIDICSGSLISSRWVLTAAHCFEGLDPHHVTVGDYDKYRRDQDEQKIAVLKVFSHPHYMGMYYDHDIGLLLLRSPVILSDYARPICLPTPGLGRLLTQEGEIGQVSGWGSTRYKGPNSRFLLRVQLPIVSQDTCMASTDKVLTGNMFCAGYNIEAKDSCNGDSGGPFAIAYRNTWYLLGVVSWGEGCAAEGKYGVYTRVSNYIQWIKDTILEMEGDEEPLVTTL